MKTSNDMKDKNFFSIATVLSLGGTLFAGYLSGVKLFSGTCAFSEPCPYFLGYPACWYGFAMFLGLLLFSLLGRFGKTPAKEAAEWLMGFSALGTIFSGSFVVQEVYAWFAAGNVSLYGLGLPTCVYGLIFYIALLIISVRFLTRRPAA